MSGCGSPKTKDMGSFWASREWNGRVKFTQNGCKSWHFTEPGCENIAGIINDNVFESNSHIPCTIYCVNYTLMDIEGNPHFGL